MKPREVSYTVALRSGGTITLSIPANLFHLDKTDRDFVFDLVDKMRAYSAARTLEPTEPLPMLLDPAVQERA